MNNDSLPHNEYLAILQMYSKVEFIDEIEFRVGYFRNKKFYNTLTQEHFDLLNIKLNTINKPRIIERSLVFIGSLGIRKIIILNDTNKSKKTFQEKKEKRDIIDLYSLKIRLSRSSEQENNQSTKFSSVRYRIRHSYISDDKNWRYDFTIVRQYKIENENTIKDLVKSGKIFDEEVKPDLLFEVELLNKKLNPEDFISSFINQIKLIYGKDDDTVFNKMYRLFNNNIKHHFGFKDFINQPITMQLRDIHKLETEDYAVSEKADGIRTLLFIDEKSNAYFINNTSIIPIKMKTNFINILADGEFISSLDTLYTFDLMSYNKDITKLDLRQRYFLLEEFVKSLKHSRISIKKQLMVESAQPNQIYSLTAKVLDSKYKYATDGLIYTPINQEYFNNPNTLKWKPAHETTIDFLIKKNKEFDESIEYHLYVGINRGDFIKLGLKKESDYALLFPKIDPDSNYFPILFNPIDLGKNLYILELNKSLNIPDNIIVELYYKDFKWNFRNIRKDKTDEYLKYNNNFGNTWRTAYTNMQAIINPVTEEIIRGRMPVPFFLPESNKDIIMKPLRKFHNDIKRMLYNKYFKNKDWILEVAAGRMGDIHKLIKNNVHNIVGFDKDQDAIQEAKTRLSHIDLGNTNVYLGVADAFNPWIPIIKDIIGLDDVPTFDGISIQFAIHFFLKDNKTLINLVNNVRSICKKGSYFIATGLDGSLVIDLFNKNKISKGQILELKKNGKIIISLKRDHSLDQLSETGQQISVYLDSIGIFHPEYLINFDHVINTFTKNGFKLIKSELFKKLYNDDYNLSSAEKTYSFLGRFIVLKCL